MLSLIYGTNQVAVRNYILKTAGDLFSTEIKEYAVPEDPVGSIESTLQTDIFGGSVLNVIDVTKILKPQLEKLFELLKRYPYSAVILVSSKDLEAASPLMKVVRALKGRVIPATVARPNEVFKFLDDLFNKRAEACSKSLQKLLETDNDPVYILVMLQYQLKNIMLSKVGLGNKLPPFQVGAVSKQAQNFTEGQLIELYGLLFEYDVALKTGKILPEAVTLLTAQKILMG